MKILSFDVGIKNLAYCLFSINCCNDKLLNIIKWDVINLCQSTSSSNKIKYTCSMCKKNAYYYLKANESEKIGDSENAFTTTTMYCKKHAVETKLLIDDGKKNKPKQSKIDTKSKQPQPQPPPCLTLIVPVTQQNACDVDMIVLGRNLKTKFDLIFNDSECVIDAVVIENQIGPLAGRMKMLQGMIAQYFIMKNVDKIEFISATNKLKLFKNMKYSNTSLVETEKQENSYKLRKMQGQLVCRSLVSFYPSLHLWNQEFDKHLKKDDLADSFLQGYYYMYVNYNSMFAFELDLFINKFVKN